MPPETHKKSLLLELVLIPSVVIVLIAIMIPNFSGANKQKRVKHANKQIRILSHALENFKNDTSSYPTTQQGLQILKKSYLPQNANLKDPWHSNYHYSCPGLLNPDSYDLLSPGPDRILSTHDDIKNINAQL